jgi:hypothetical protein
MQTRILLLGVLSLVAGAASAQTGQLRIDPDVQRQRDQTRITILQDELISEALALADVQKALKSDAARSDPRIAQESSKRIARHRQNISALAREIALSERQSLGAGKAAAAPSGFERFAVEPLPLQRIVPPPAAPEPTIDERRSAVGGVPEWVISGNRGLRAP